MTEATQTLLPEAPNEALKMLIKLTKEAIAVLEAEDEAITRNDAVAFSVNEQNKMGRFDHYDKACKAFAARIDDMKGRVDVALLDELEALQGTLKKNAEMNNVRLGAILPKIRVSK